VAARYTFISSSGNALYEGLAVINFTDHHGAISGRIVINKK